MKTTNPLKYRKRMKACSDDFDFPFELIGAEDHGEMLDPTQPRIKVSGEFTMEMAEEFCRSVEILQRRGEEAALIDISSPGGDLFALFKMLNCTDASDMLFATYNSSHAYSAGGVLLAAGAKGARFAAPLSSTMLHPLSCGVAPQQIHDVVEQAGHDKALNEMLFDRLAADMGTTHAKLVKELQAPSGGGAATLWMTPQRCLEVGVIDVIGIPSFKTQTTLSVFGLEPEEEKKPAPRKAVRKR